MYGRCILQMTKRLSIVMLVIFRLKNRRVNQNVPTIHKKAPSKAHEVNRDSSEKCPMGNNVVSDTQNSGLKCNKCNKLFTCEDEFKLHMEYYHTDTQQ